MREFYKRSGTVSFLHNSTSYDLRTTPIPRLSRPSDYLDLDSLVSVLGSMYVSRGESISCLMNSHVHTLFRWIPVPFLLHFLNIMSHVTVCGCLPVFITDKGGHSNLIDYWMSRNPSHGPSRTESSLFYRDQTRDETWVNYVVFLFWIYLD